MCFVHGNLCQMIFQSESCSEPCTYSLTAEGFLSFLCVLYCYLLLHDPSCYQDETLWSKSYRSQTVGLSSNYSILVGLVFQFILVVVFGLSALLWHHSPP
uniref:Uncharacterized protein n=1 Tax=Opuntia streptacantha TaxID=393608 RepID=A0A7C9D7J1_OPUST